MKNITITSTQIKKEIILLCVSLIAALGLNIYSIIKYKTAWAELFGQFHTVIFIGLIIYLLVVLFRLLFWGISRGMNKKKE